MCRADRYFETQHLNYLRNNFWPSVLMFAKQNLLSQLEIDKVQQRCYSKEEPGRQVWGDTLSSKNGYQVPLESPDNLKTRAADLRLKIVDKYFLKVCISDFGQFSFPSGYICISVLSSFLSYCNFCSVFGCFDT